MTVQELLDKLNAVEDKTAQVIMILDNNFVSEDLEAEFQHLPQHTFAEEWECACEKYDEETGMCECERYPTFVIEAFQ